MERGATLLTGSHACNTNNYIYHVTLCNSFILSSSNLISDDKDIIHQNKHTCQQLKNDLKFVSLISLFLLLQKSQCDW